MAQDTRTRLEIRIKKLQQLHELLGDPDISAEVDSLYMSRNGNGAAPIPPLAASTPSVHHQRTRGPNRKTMKLVRVAMEVVNRSEGAVSARTVADQMTVQGFHFANFDKKYVAVSKALRWLSKKKEINALAGLTEKAPIMYTRKT